MTTLAFVRLVNTLHTSARRWTQFGGQEDAAAQSCGPSNRAQDGGMWATREPTSGAWRASSVYLSTGHLREKDFGVSFFHILQKTRIRYYHIGNVTENLFCEIIYCCFVRIKKKLRCVNNLKIHSFWRQLWLLWLHTYHYGICFYFLFICLIFRYICDICSTRILARNVYQFNAAAGVKWTHGCVYTRRSVRHSMVRVQTVTAEIKICRYGSLATEVNICSFVLFVSAETRTMSFGKCKLKTKVALPDRCKVGSTGVYLQKYLSFGTVLVLRNRALMWI
jgi:hypothetical protein